MQWLAWHCELNSAEFALVASMIFLPQVAAAVLVVCGSALVVDV